MRETLPRGDFVRAFCRLTAQRGIVPLMVALVTMATQADAGEIEPRSYVNTPAGINFLLAGYAYTDGGLATAGSSPIKDAQLTMHTEIIAYARSFDVFGASGKLDVIVPYSILSGTAMVAGNPRERDVSGFNDPRFRFSVNFYGAPAMSLEEFANYQQDLILGASLQVSAPLGQYDREKLVNIGNNRWFFKPDVGISKAWGDFVLELSGSATFFTDNDEFYGGKRLEQDPVYTGQVHATYNLAKGIWLAVSTTYDGGGRTTNGGVRNDDGLDNSRVGATLSMALNRNNSLKLYGSSGIHTRVGNDYDMVGLLWQYRWGGGL